jgi:hypothetical protein
LRDVEEIREEKVVLTQLAAIETLSLFYLYEGHEPRV